jgi:hypothetical protein
MTRMNATVKALWVDDLRNTPHKQIKSLLCDSGGFCCLGRLTDLYINSDANVDKEQWIESDVPGVKKFSGKFVLLSDKVKDWAGLTIGEGARVIVPKHVNVSTQIRERGSAPLSLLNDHGLTFHELADIIEEQL